MNEHLSRAILIIDSLLKRGDVQGEVKLRLLEAKRELYNAKDKLAIVKSQVAEMVDLLSELVSHLRLESSIGGLTTLIYDPSLKDLLKESDYIEASVKEDNAVRIERIAISLEKKKPGRAS